jgi:hypothetical protein
MKRIFIIFVLSLVALSCDNTINEGNVQNYPPTTKIFLTPDSIISKQPSKIQLFWMGDDKDGLVVGYYISFDSLNWSFTTKNDSTFYLKIGVRDTIYKFYVAAVDNYGNKAYDNQVIRNGINFGPEPFDDINKNGIREPNEKFYDIGNIDPNPAKLILPIKNSQPVITLPKDFSMPDSSLPVLTLSLNISDIDGDETISSLQIALNDTSKFITLPGETRLICLRVDRNTIESPNPQMEILINGLENAVYSKKLSGLKLNDFNKVFIRAEDIAGARSDILTIPTDPEKQWKVIKPKSKILIIDDYKLTDDADQFYINLFNNLTDSTNNTKATGKFDIINLQNYKVSYLNVTFYETLKLYETAFWYTDNNPSIDLAASVSQKYISKGGKLFFSFQLPQTFDRALMTGFLPIDSLSAKSIDFILPNVLIIPYEQNYPTLKVKSSIARVRFYYPNPAGAAKIYNLNLSQPSGEKPIAFISGDSKLFFIGLPLNKIDGNNNVNILVHKIFFEKFGLKL